MHLEDPEPQEDENQKREQGSGKAWDFQTTLVAAFEEAAKSKLK